MSVSISISANEVKGVVGKYNKNALYISGCGEIDMTQELEAALPEEKGEVLKNSIFSLWKQLNTGEKEIDLVICSSTFITKVVEVPKMSQSHLYHIARQELLEFFDDEKEYVCDYTFISGRTESGGSRMLCAAIEKKLIDQMVQTFRQVGLNLRCIDISPSIHYKVPKLVPRLRQENCIVAVVSGDFMETMLVEDGHLVQSNRSALEQRESISMVASLNHAISSMMQYQKSQRSDNEIHNIYLCGLRETEIPYCKNITNAMGIDAQVLPDEYSTANNASGYSVAKYYYATGNLIRK